MTIGVKLTVKEKIEQETAAPSQPEEGENGNNSVSVGTIPRGIVKWLVDVYDETGETVAIATILTMVAKRAG